MEHIHVPLTEYSTFKGKTYTVEDAVEKFGIGPYQVMLMLIVGLAWMSDAMEMALLGIIVPAVRCDWNLLPIQAATISIAVFVGYFLGTWFWGFLSDKFGRRKTIIISTVWIFYFGLLSAFSPNIVWLVFLRSLVGLGMGGIPQCVNLYAEFLPTHKRGVYVNFILFAWSFGICFESIIAYFVMPTLGWRWLLVISSFPLLIFLVCFSWWLPESVRFLSTIGDTQRTLLTLEKVGRMNKTSLPEGQLVLTKKTQPRGRLKDLFTPEYRVTTVLTWIIWFSSHFIIYGLALMTTEIFALQDPCYGGKPSDDSVVTCVPCKTLKSEDYFDYFIVMSADFPGILFIVLLVEKLGRKKMFALSFFGSSIFFILLFICTGSRTITTVYLWGARCFISISDVLGYIYTPEVYPTYIRGIGLGSSSGMGRVGCLLTPLVAQVLVPISLIIPLALYTGSGVIGMILSVLLPIETMGRALQDDGGKREEYDAITDDWVDTKKE